MRTYMSCFSTKLQVSYKRRFSKAVRNHFRKISFEDSGNYRNIEICI